MMQFQGVPGMGTVINMVVIVIGGFIGLMARNYLKARLLETLMAAMSVCILFIGFIGAIKESLALWLIIL